MYKDNYNELYINIKKIVAIIIKDLCELENREKSVEKGAQIQQLLINLGNTLEEKYCLSNTIIINKIEICCEVIYQYFCEEKDTSLLELVNNLEALPESLKDSVNISDDKLSIVAIIKNEAKYIKEWIEYHRMMGVSHFYIYDNESSDNVEMVLEDYVQKGIVTYTFFPGGGVQLDAYNDALKKYRFDTKYMAFIDADEFVVVSEDYVEDKKIHDVLDEIVTSYESVKERMPGCVGGVGINWRTFGTGFHSDIQEGLCIENYKYRANDKHCINWHIKTICIPRFVTEFTLNPHSVNYLSGYYCISENGSYIPNAFFADGRCEKLRINHYYSRSETEMMNKIKRGRATVKDFKFSQEFIDDRMKMVKEDFNEVYDYTMEKYVGPVRERIEKIDELKNTHA